MAADSAGHVYVSNAGSNTVSVIDDPLLSDAALSPKAAPSGQPTLIGSQLPPFRLRDDNGKEHALDEYRGKILMLNFFASW